MKFTWTLRAFSIYIYFKKKELNSRQERWFELLKDYNVNILCHPRRANIVADALNRESMDGVDRRTFGNKELVCKTYRSASLGVRLVGSEDIKILI